MFINSDRSVMPPTVLADSYKIKSLAVGSQKFHFPYFASVINAVD